MITVLVQDRWAWWWTVPGCEPSPLPRTTATSGPPPTNDGQDRPRRNEGALDPNWQVVVSVVSEAVVRSAGCPMVTAGGGAQVKVVAHVSDVERRLCQAWLGDDAMPVTGEPSGRSLVSGGRSLHAARAVTEAPLPVRSLTLSHVRAAIHGHCEPVIAEAVREEVAELRDWWRTAPEELVRVNHQHLASLSAACGLLRIQTSAPTPGRPDRASPPAVVASSPPQGSPFELRGDEIGGRPAEPRRSLGRGDP